MKTIFLYSDDLLLIARWSKLINAQVSMVDDLKELENIEYSIIIFNISVCKEISDESFQTLVNNKNNIMILDNMPNLANAKKYLNLGVKAYGNTLMTSSYLNSSIEALQKDYIWLIPDISTKLMNEMIVSNKMENNNKADEIFKELTSKEKEVAILVKEAYTNNKISQELDISINTVKTHVKHIYEKLNVKDRLSFLQLFNK